MRAHVEFRSHKFTPYPGKEAEVNPGVWGKRLAEYGRDRLAGKGIAVGEIYAEDWGWAVPLQHEAFPMWIGCGHCLEYPDGHLVCIEPSKPTIRKGLFKKIDTTADVERVADWPYPSFHRCVECGIDTLEGAGDGLFSPGHPTRPKHGHPQALPFSPGSGILLSHDGLQDHILSP